MTVRQNLGYGLKVRGTPKADVASRVEDVGKVLGLEELLYRVHECVFGVLALESEPVDPRL